MAGDGKLIAKIQIRITEEEKRNLDKDIQSLAKQLKDQTGTMITRSDFVRLVLEDLHAKIAESIPLVWPPRLEAKEQKRLNERRRTGLQ